MDASSRLICMLPCRSLTRYALSSMENLLRVLGSFLFLGFEIGLLHGDPQQWVCLDNAARLCCFTKWLPPLIRASHRLSNHNALWLVEPLPGLSSAARAKGKGKGCMINHSVYHSNLSEEEQKRISTIINEETGKHYRTVREWLASRQRMAAERCDADHQFSLFISMLVELSYTLSPMHIADGVMWFCFQRFSCTLCQATFLIEGKNVVYCRVYSILCSI